MATKPIPAPPPEPMSPLKFAGFMAMLWAGGFLLGRYVAESSIKRTSNKNAVYECGAEGIPTKYNKAMKHAPAGIGGLFTLLVGLLVGFSLGNGDATVAVRIWVVCGGLILIIGGYRSGLFIKYLSDWKRLEDFGLAWETYNSLPYRVVTRYPDRSADLDIFSRSERVQQEKEYRVKMDQDHGEAVKYCIFGGICFAVLWAVSGWLMSHLSLPREAASLYVIVPCIWAMICLSYPIGKYAAVALDLYLHGKGYQYLPGAHVLEPVEDRVDIKDVERDKPLGSAGFASSGFAPQSPRQPPPRSPQSPHQPPPQSPHQPSAKPASKYQNPFE